MLKIKEADLETALKDEKEVELAIPEGLEVLTKEELEARDTAQKNEGIKAGKEIGVKEVRKAAGLEENGPKDPAKLVQAISEKVVADAKIKPDEKVSQLTEQIGLLQKQIGEKDTEIQTSRQVASQAQIDRKILASLPKNRAGNLSDDEYITLIKATHTIKEVDGKLVIEKDGTVMRDPKTTNAMGLSEAMNSIFTERKGWLGESNDTPGGRGGGNPPPAGGYSKLSDLKKSFADQGKSLLGEEFSQAVQKAATDNKEFDMNS